jgi:hypothetical protein
MGNPDHGSARAKRLDFSGCRQKGRTQVAMGNIWAVEYSIQFTCLPACHPYHFEAETVFALRQEY